MVRNFSLPKLHCLLSNKRCSLLLVLLLSVYVNPVKELFLFSRSIELGLFKTRWPNSVVFKSGCKGTDFPANCQMFKALFYNQTAQNDKHQAKQPQRLTNIYRRRDFSCKEEAQSIARLARTFNYIIK